uniref:AlNc14C521G12036 protein n=1 Tax=Albugo laibachii Nc14 TaxID=890382 RepID=F0X0U6_9STRA|nr:AlNc14C521G12036 [Albugo laibachii Nc14]|eukprot:CCA27391.1 AlNc14C521G12036 [Albugo laibachii Nc14]
MSPTKISSAKTREESDRADESKMDRMMMLLEMLGNRVDKIETERSAGSPTAEPPVQVESVFTGHINQGQGLTMPSLAARPVQHQGSGIRRSFFHAMQNDVLDGLNHIKFPAARDVKLAIQSFDGRETYSDLEHRLPSGVIVSCDNYRMHSKRLAGFGQVTQWMTQCSSVEEVMDRINEVFRPNITKTQETRFAYKGVFDTEVSPAKGVWQLRNWTLQVEDDKSSNATTKEGVLKGPKIRL